MTITTTNLLTGTVVLLLCLPGFQGYQQYVSQIPNGNAVGNIQALGHVNPSGGGSRNDFGKGYTSGWPLSYCQADSDGDSLSNGFELGDPCCVWSFGQVPQVTSDLSHPGKASGSYAQPVNRKCSDFNCSNGIDPCTASSAWSTNQFFHGGVQYGIIAIVMGYLMVQQYYDI